MTNLKALFEQKKLNNRSNRIEIPQAFRTKFADLTPTKSQKYFDQYVTAVASAVMKQLPWIDANNEVSVSTSQLFDACGSFQYKKERCHVWNEFKDIYPFFHVVEAGSNLRHGNGFEKNSRVQIHPRMTNMMLNERAPHNVFYELFDGYNLAEPAVEVVDIDMENLNNFIEGTDYELTKATDPVHQAKLQKSLYQAQLVYKVGLHTEQESGLAFLPMIPSKSPFGRTYYKGLNIQNVTKEVRSAIIGPHFQYDMNAAVYGIKLALFNDINGGENNLVGTSKGTYTREYLTNKDAIRKRLADHCYEGIAITDAFKLKNVKNALTAIGFGAKTTSGFWFSNDELKSPALTQIMKSAVARERFLSDPWVINFLNEQTAIEEDIVDSMKSWENYDDICNEIRQSAGRNGRVTKPLLLAYVYQHCETSLMDEAVAIVEARGIRVKARIHDAFIVMNPVPAKVMDEIMMTWVKYSSHISLDRDEVRGWIPVDFKRALDQQSEALAEHKANIATEDRMGRIYALKKSGAA